MENVSNFVITSFVLTSLFTVWLFYKASSQNYKTLLVIGVWGIFISLLAFNGFYSNTDASPPRFAFLIGPGFLFIALLFVLRGGKRFVDKLNLKWLTILHVVRIPVELVLHSIYLSGLIPVYMTFEGYNLDILSGLTAPIVYYLVFIRKSVGYKSLLIWNIAALVLLINILVIAILSAETPFQQMAFEQPNIGVAYFPLVWLPGIIVPLVMISHIAAIQRLWKKGNLS